MSARGFALVAGDVPLAKFGAAAGTSRFVVTVLGAADEPVVGAEMQVVRLGGEAKAKTRKIVDQTTVKNASSNVFTVFVGAGRDYRIAVSAAGFANGTKSLVFNTGSPVDVNFPLALEVGVPSPLASAKASASAGGGAALPDAPDVEVLGLKFCDAREGAGDFDRILELIQQKLPADYATLEATELDAGRKLLSCSGTPFPRITLVFFDAAAGKKTPFVIEDGGALKDYWYGMASDSDVLSEPSAPKPVDPTAVPDPAPSAPPASGEALPALIFSIAQGWGNDLVGKATDDAAIATALGHTIDVVKAYGKRFDTFVLINPVIKDKSKLRRVLAMLDAAGVQFVFDVMSSDTYNLGMKTEHNNAANQVAGLGLWPDPAGDANSDMTLAYYAKNYPRTFKGLRIHEPELARERFAKEAWEVSGLQTYMDQIVQFAKTHDMWVEFSGTFMGCGYGANPYGDAHPCDAQVAGALRQEVAHLMVKYPGVIYPTWPNNDGTALRRLDPASGLKPWDWLVSEGLPSFDGKPPGWGSRGKGLSNQSWITGAVGRDGVTPVPNEREMPHEYLMRFIADAKAKGAAIIQFEPYWYFFKWPGLAWPGDPEPADPLNGSTERGKVTTQGCWIGSELGGVLLPGC